jgi:23S rRNA maturation-related 3'-5' exoribonuclease YhaM
MVVAQVQTGHLLSTLLRVELAALEAQVRMVARVVQTITTNLQDRPINMREARDQHHRYLPGLAQTLQVVAVVAHVLTLQFNFLVIQVQQVVLAVVAPVPIM